MKLAVQVPDEALRSTVFREGFRNGVLAAEEALEFKIEWSVPPQTKGFVIPIDIIVSCDLAQAGAEFKVSSLEFPLSEDKQNYIENELKRICVRTLFGLR